MGAKGSKQDKQAQQADKARQSKKGVLVKWLLERKLNEKTITALFDAGFDVYALTEASEQDFKDIPEITHGQRVLLRKAISELKAAKFKDKDGQYQPFSHEMEERKVEQDKDTYEHTSSVTSKVSETNRATETLHEVVKFTSYEFHVKVDKDDGYLKPGENDEYRIQQTVKAIAGFTARSANELSFRADDRFVILDTAGNWLYTRHPETGKKGYIPRSFVVADHTRDWWFDISRQEANEHLLMPGLRNGTFCVRDSSEINKMALSVRYKMSASTQPLNSVRHYKIKLENNGQTCYIASQKKFPDIDSLLKFYQENSRLCCKLSKPCPRMPQTVPFKDMEIERDSIQILQLEAEGNFATVYKGKWKDQIDVAVKMLKSGQMEKSCFEEEARVMHRLSHRHLVQFMGVCTKEEPFYIITEYMEHGSLRKYLIEANMGEVNFVVLMSIAAQITDGMTYLEELNCIHRDVRADNMLVGANKMVKIADFGLARIGDEYLSTGSMVPVKWTSPESYRHKRFTVKSDVWSFGVLLYEIITYGEVPYPDVPNNKVQRMVQRSYRMPKPTNYLCPDDIYDKMIQCWNPEPSLRPSFKKLHSFFAKYRLKKEDIPPEGYSNNLGVIDDDIVEDYYGYIKIDYIK